MTPYLSDGHIEALAIALPILGVVLIALMFIDPLLRRRSASSPPGPRTPPPPRGPLMGALATPTTTDTTTEGDRA